METVLIIAVVLAIIAAALYRGVFYPPEFEFDDRWKKYKPGEFCDEFETNGDWLAYKVAPWMRELESLKARRKRLRQVARSQILGKDELKAWRKSMRMVRSRMSIIRRKLREWSDYGYAEVMG